MRVSGFACGRPRSTWFCSCSSHAAAVVGLRDGVFPVESVIRGPMDLLISYVLPTVAVIVFWKYKSATPGKMVFSAKIVDATDRRKAVVRPVDRALFCLRRFHASVGVGISLDRLRPKEAGVARQTGRHGRDPRVRMSGDFGDTCR